MKTMFSKLTLSAALLILGGVFLSGCTTSRLVDVWKDPQYNFNSINKVVVIAGIEGKARRRIWEDSFVKVLSRYGIDATPSYKYYPDDIPKPADVHNLVNNKFDGIVLIRRLKSTVYRQYIPGDDYAVPIGWVHYPFFRRYDMVYSYCHMPGYFVHNKVFNFNVELYNSNDKGDLLWEGTGEVANPASRKDLLKELSNLVVPKMMNKTTVAER